MNAALRSSAVTVLVMVASGCGQVSGSPTTSGAGSTTAAAPSTSPSTAPSAATDRPAAPPQPPVEFTGRITNGPPVAPGRAGTEETVDVGTDGLVLTRFRDGAWKQTVTMSDPRLEGTIYVTLEGDSYRVPGAETGPEIFAVSHRIENADGAWTSRVIGMSYSDGTTIGESPEVFIGEGAYAGLIAILEVTRELDGPPHVREVRGMIFAGAPLPEPYIPD